MNYLLKNYRLILVLALIIFGQSQLCASTETTEGFIFRSPTERFLEDESWPKVCRGLRSLDLSREHKDFFDKMAKSEKVGFFGYHGSTQTFRIYEDIVRWILEEKVGVATPADFHYFRLPGHPQYDHVSLKEYGSYLNDYNPNNFLCLNYAAYSNYKNDFFSSYYYFATNTSSSTVDYEEKLNWLFDQLGIDRAAIHEIYSTGLSYLGSISNGVIYQLFDISHEREKENPYTFVDPLIGTFAPNDMPFSEAIQGTKPTHFYLQTRLLINNCSILNPYSPLVIKRYDNLDSKIVQQYEEAMKKSIRMLKTDPSKVEIYKKLLSDIWQIVE